MEIDISYYVKKYKRQGAKLPRVSNVNIITFLEMAGFNFAKFCNTYSMQKQEIKSNVIGAGATTYVLRNPKDTNRVLGITVDPSKVYYLYNIGLLHHVEPYSKNLWVYEMDKLKPVPKPIGVFLSNSIRHKKCLTNRVIFNRELLDSTIEKFKGTALEDLHYEQFMYDSSTNKYVCVDPIVYKGINLL